ncbi:MAG: hypothetical protein IJ685_06020 [Selenomonadaceae bacterium]|nr:hypothetical protein [Selenomonadaceae bacterium]
MLKKILLTIIAVLIAGGALMIYGTYKVADEAIKAKEPQLRQYIQLDEAAQNKYVIEHAEELLKEVTTEDVSPEDKEDMELFNEAQKYPEMQAALLKVGRSLFAKAIVHSDAIVKDLSADVKAKYQAEADAFSDNLKVYGDTLKQIGDKIKAAK